MRLLDELQGCHILSGNEKGAIFCRSHIDDLVKQMADVVADVFRAALQNPVHFQVGILQKMFPFIDKILIAALTERIRTFWY